MARSRDGAPCPACGAAVPAGAVACRACGADARTGWGDDDDAAAVETAQELDLPTSAADDDEAYDAWRAEQEGRDDPYRPTPPSRRGVLLVVLLVVAVAAILALLAPRPR